MTQLPRSFIFVCNLPPQGSYHYTQDEGYQDALGRTVLECCTAIPDGVLLFMSSYALMDRLTKRWKVGLGLGCLVVFLAFRVILLATPA